MSAARSGIGRQASDAATFAVYDAAALKGISFSAGNGPRMFGDPDGGIKERHDIDLCLNHYRRGCGKKLKPYQKDAPLCRRFILFCLETPTRKVLSSPRTLRNAMAISRI